MHGYFKLLSRSALIAVMATALLYAWPARAVEVSEEDFKAMQQRLKDLETKVKVMEGQLQEFRGAAPNQPRKSPTVVLGDNGLVVHSPNSNFVSYMHGYLQVDGRFYPNANSVNDTFLLRRVRPILEGTVYRNFDYRFMFDFGSGNGIGSSAGNNALLNDAYANVRYWRQFQIQVGKFKSPIGLERLASVADLPFIETGFATQLTPNYDLGVNLHNRLFNTPVNYAIGVFNGAMDAASDDQDVSNDGKDVVGRLFFQPFLRTDQKALQKLGFGVGGSIGTQTGPLPSYKTPGQQTFFKYASGVAADGQQYRIDPQLYWYWGPFGILGEYVLSSQSVKGNTAGARSARFNNTGWQVEASYFLTGEENSFKPTSLIRVAPLHPLVLGELGWGALEAAGRVHQLSLDKNALPAYVSAESAKRATALGVGVNWYLNRNVKFSLDYEWTKFGEGSAKPDAVTSKHEDVILTQFQLAF